MSKQVTKTLYWYKNTEHDYEGVGFDDMHVVRPETYITLGKCEAVFEMTMTDAEITAAQVAGLEEQKIKIRAVAQAAITNIENKIQSLLSITHEA